MKHYIYSLFLLFCFASSIAAEPAGADSSKREADKIENGSINLFQLGCKQYAQQEYEEALNSFVQLSRMGESASLFYNIGNCYYRLDSLGKALAYYERALRIDPTDKDIQRNIDVVRAQTIDNIEIENDGFFNHMIDGISSVWSSNAWAVLSVVFWGILLFSIGAYLVAPAEKLRRCAVLLSVFSVICFVCAVFFSRWQMSRQEENSEAVVIKTAEVKSSPEKLSKSVLLLHDGTKVVVTDSLNDFFEIKMNNNSRGWVLKSDVEVI